MNSPLELQRLLSLLDQLRVAAQSGAARADTVSRELQQTLARVDRLFEADLANFQQQLSAAEAESETTRLTVRSHAEARNSQRRNRLTAAHSNLKDQQLRALASEEAREVFHIQRALLQTARDQDAGRQRADELLAATQSELAAERESLDALRHRILDTFRGYTAFRRLVAGPTHDTAIAPMADEQQLLKESRDLRTRVESDLARLRRSPLVRLFSLLPLGFVATTLTAVAAAAVPILQFTGRYPLSWSQAAIALTTALASTFLLHALGGRLARPTAHRIAADVAHAYIVLDAADRVAATHHHHELLRLAAEAQSTSESLQAKWSSITQQTEARRDQLRQRFESKLARASARNDRILQQRLLRFDEIRDRDLARLREEAAAGRQRAELRRTQSRLDADTHADAAWRSIQSDWDAVMIPAYAAFAEARDTAERLFLPWSSPLWEQWSPPADFLAAAPFARLQIEVLDLVGSLPHDPRLRLPGEDSFSLPLVLTFPNQGCILFETADTGRESAIGSLNNLILRLLAGSPPGRARFTILDPAGLGQNFAGLMHLTDHEDRLINRRIWTQPDHIESRLAELNEHVEKVTQLYLRNEYSSIAEYNEQAGRIAEPYQFLVVADFPVNFSDVAIRRLLSLAASGPRCGLYTLIHWDTRRPNPAEFVSDDLRRPSIVLRHEAGRFTLSTHPLPGTQLALEPPPDPNRATSFLQRVGRSSVDSNRIEMPFVHAAPEPNSLWSLDTTSELRVPIGRTGATKLQYLALGKGTRQHALIAGKTGSGKSTLFHVLITNLALWCDPSQVEFYLVDFKKGVEFKCYAAHQLPHARVIAIESDREFGLSVLQRVDAELQRRGDLFRQAGAQDLPGFKRSNHASPLPRTLLIIDEFQELFTEDDRVAQNAALLLDRLVRQGRAFGIHVLLGSQTLGGAYTLARSTLGQMVVRVALQCNEADALLIMDDDNTAPRLLSRPGEAIYNDAAGAIEGNSPFQVVWLPDDERESWLQRIRLRADANQFARATPFVFEGNHPADIRDNYLLHDLLHARSITPTPAPRIWLGAPNAIKGPTELILHRQSGHHVLLLGQHDESSLALLGVALVSLAAQLPYGTARFLLLDVTPVESPHRQFLERIARAIPHPFSLVTQQDLSNVLQQTATELDHRAEASNPESAPSIFLVIHHLQRFRSLRFEEDFGLRPADGNTQADPGQILNRLLTDGARLGLHVLCLCDTYNNATRFLSRRALAEFELRVLFQMNANDSANLIDNSKASTLGLYRALLHQAREGTLETFRPYALPDPTWVQDAALQLARLAATSAASADSTLPDSPIDKTQPSPPRHSPAAGA